MIVVKVDDINGNTLKIPINAVSYLKIINGKTKSYFAIVKGDSLELNKKDFDELDSYMTREKEYVYPKRVKE